MKDFTKNRYLNIKWTYAIILALATIGSVGNATVLPTTGSVSNASVLGLDAQNPPIVITSVENDLLLSKLLELQSDNFKINNENAELKSKLNEAYYSLKELENIKKQNLKFKDDIEQLKEQQKTPSWVGWMGILLAAVAAIVTTLGVFIALFSFYGYKKLIDETKNIAKTKTSETIPQVLPEYTKSALIELIESGTFNDVIEDAVLKVTFRGVEYESNEDM